MAWDWNASGRIDDFEFEKISPKDLETKLGDLEGVVGGTLTYSYFSSLKVSGQLQIINAKSSMAEDEYLIRIWYCPRMTPDGTPKRIELGTFYFSANLKYENNVYSGNIDLRSCLARHIDDVIPTKLVLKAGKTKDALWKNMFKVLGGKYEIINMKPYTKKKNKIFAAGTPVMEVLEYIAKMGSDCEITVNSHGKTVLQNYETPQTKAKNIKHTLIADEKSVVRTVLDISNSLKEIPNRAVFAYEETKTETYQKNGKTKTKHTSVTHLGKATLSSKHARSHAKINRWITHYEKVDECEKAKVGGYSANLKKMAKSYLKRNNIKYTYYEFECFYQPIELGEVIRFTYGDINIKGMVTNIDLSLEVGAKMRVKVRKV